jgi:hypothetical protein
MSGSVALCPLGHRAAGHVRPEHRDSYEIALHECAERDDAENHGSGFQVLTVQGGLLQEVVVVVVVALFVSDQMELPSTSALINGMREMRMDAPTTPMVVAMISITIRFLVGNQLSPVDTSCPLTMKEIAGSQRKTPWSLFVNHGVLRRIADSANHGIFQGFDNCATPRWVVLVSMMRWK